MTTSSNALNDRLEAILEAARLRPSFDQAYLKLDIAVARSQPRDLETGAICFDVTYPDSTWSRVPIQAFVDLSDDTFTHEAVADAVNDWVATAKRYPFVRRNCLCCRHRATKGAVLCTKCAPKWSEAVYA